MKTNANFKMSKESKRVLAITPIEKRSMMKHFMIDAEIAEAKAKQAKIKDNNKPELE